MDEDIKATAHFRKDALQGVTAVIRVPIDVEIDLFADGTYTVRAKNEVVVTTVDAIEQTIERAFDEDALAEAYARSLEVDFDV